MRLALVEGLGTFPEATRKPVVHQCILKHLLRVGRRVSDTYIPDVALPYLECLLYRHFSLGRLLGLDLNFDWGVDFNFISSVGHPAYKGLASKGCSELGKPTFVGVYELVDVFVRYRR